MNSIGIIGGADGPTAVYVTSKPSLWMVAFFCITAVISVTSVVLGLVSLHKAKKAAEEAENEIEENIE